jgi:hypothetical protein
MDGITPSELADELHRDGSQSRLCLDGQFLGSVALLMTDQTLFLPLHPFNWIGIRTLCKPKKSVDELCSSRRSSGESVDGFSSHMWMKRRGGGAVHKVQTDPF